MLKTCIECQDTGKWDYYDYDTNGNMIAKPIGEGEYFSYCDCELGVKLYEENTDV